MKLYRVSFPDILIGAYSKQDAEDQIYSSVAETEYEHDFNHFDIVEVTNEQQIDNFDPYYVPYHTTGGVTAEDILQVTQILEGLTEKQIKQLKTVFNNE
jgi:hypothetical protein